MFKTLDLENFTVFEKASFEWVEGINVFVGENGTGKTHLLKLLYCSQTSGEDDEHFERALQGNFLPTGEPISALIRNLSNSSVASVCFTTSGENLAIQLRFSYENNAASTGLLFETESWSTNTDAVYIPPKEILSGTVGLLPVYRKYRIPIESIYHDIVEKAYILPLRQHNKAYDDILYSLEDIIGGQVNVQGDVFYIGTRTMHLVAEGHRKLALICQLILNGSIDSGTTLFWDEPEANLNPALMQEVVKVLLLLAQNGVQIFIATHNYALLRELDFQKNNTPLRFFALEKTLNKGVVPHASENYFDIKPNKIAEEHLRLYDLEVKRSLGDF